MRGGIDPGASSFSSPISCNCTDLEGFLIRGWEVFLTGCGGTSALARVATLAACWLHNPQPIHGDLRFRLRADVFLIRGWEFILPECCGTLALARGATLAGRCLHEPQLTSDHPVGLGFSQRPRRYRPRLSLFSSPGCWSCRGIKRFLIRGYT